MMNKFLLGFVILAVLLTFASTCLRLADSPHIALVATASTYLTQSFTHILLAAFGFYRYFLFWKAMKNDKGNAISVKIGLSYINRKPNAIEIFGFFLLAFMLSSVTQSIAYVNDPPYEILQWRQISSGIEWYMLLFSGPKEEFIRFAILTLGSQVRLLSLLSALYFSFSHLQYLNPGYMNLPQIIMIYVFLFGFALLLNYIIIRFGIIYAVGVHLLSNALIVRIFVPESYDVRLMVIAAYLAVMSAAALWTIKMLPKTFEWWNERRLC